MSRSCGHLLRAQSAQAHALRWPAPCMQAWVKVGLQETGKINSKIPSVALELIVLCSHEELRQQGSTDDG